MQGAGDVPPEAGEETDDVFGGSESRRQPEIVERVAFGQQFGEEVAAGSCISFAWDTLDRCGQGEHGAADAVPVERITVNFEVECDTAGPEDPTDDAAIKLDGELGHSSGSSISASRRTPVARAIAKRRSAKIECLPVSISQM